MGEHQHGVSIQISINLGKTFLRISRIRNIPMYMYLLSFPRFWTDSEVQTSILAKRPQRRGARREGCSDSQARFSNVPLRKKDIEEHTPESKFLLPPVSFLSIKILYNTSKSKLQQAIHTNDSHFQNQAQFYLYIKNKYHSLIDGFALSLAFKQRLGQLKKGLLQGDIICADEQFVCIVHDCCCSWYVSRLHWVYYLNNLL